MFKAVQRWWRTRRCLSVGHQPGDKVLHCQINTRGEEYLEGRNCACGKERFCVSLADRQQLTIFPSVDDATSPRIIAVSPEEAKGWHKRRLARKGYEIIELARGTSVRSQSKVARSGIGQPARST